MPGPRVMVIVPVKSFDAAKARLDGALDVGERAALARSMAATVIRAAAPLPVVVVTDDDAVAVFAAEEGAGVVRQVGAGLNAAVSEGVAFAAGAGFRRAVIAHADLPRARALAVLAEGGGDEVVIVPDRHEDGTNVLVVPTDAGFGFAYGPGSFAAHRLEAERLGLAVRIVLDPDLAWDVDTPDDLKDPRSA